MTLHCNQVAASALALHFVLSSAVHHSLSFVGSGPATGTAPYPTPPSWRCRPSRLVVPASLRPESPAEQKKSPAGGSPTDKTPTAQDEDERQTERWGVAPTASPSKSRKPLEAVRSSIRAVGDGVSSAKDAVYEVVDAAGTLIESSQRGIQGAMAEGETPSSPSGADSDSANRVMPLSKGNPKRSGDKEGWGAVLKAVGGGAVFVKDALWGSVELLGEAAESAKQAPETARNAVEGSKAALESAKGSVQSIASAPGRAIEAISDAVGSAGRAVAGVKDGAYGTADAIGRLASAPAAVAERRRREQQTDQAARHDLLPSLLPRDVVRPGQERDEEEVERALARREAASRLDGAVEGAKAAVWGTVDGVESLLEIVTSAPSSVESGFTRVQEAVDATGNLAKTTGDVVQSIPGRLERVPLEAQRKVDSVRDSVASTRSAAASVVTEVRDGIDGAVSLAQRVADEASGKAGREREEAARLAEIRAREEARREKERNAVITFQGEPYTAQDLAKKSLDLGVEGAKGAVELGKGIVWAAGKAWVLPSQVTRGALGPLYEFQQSQRRVQDAVAKQSPRRSASRSAPEPAPAATLPASSPSSPAVGSLPSSANTGSGDPVTDGGTSPGESPTRPSVDAASSSSAGESPAAVGSLTAAEAAAAGTSDKKGVPDKGMRRDYRPSWGKKPRGIDAD